MTKRNRKRFSQQSVDKLNYVASRAPPSGRMEIEDELCPGLMLRVTPNGSKTYSVIYKVRGEGGLSPDGRLLVAKQHRITLGNAGILNLKEARTLAREIMQAANEGRDSRDQRREANRIRVTNSFSNVLGRFIDFGDEAQYCVVGGR